MALLFTLKWSQIMTLGVTCFRHLCRIGPSRTWEDLLDVIPPHSVQRLRGLYQRPEDVDLYIGQNMEMSE